jgi:Ca-activated chloride channel family protein
MTDALQALVSAIAAEWQRLDVGGLQFLHRDTARLAAFALVALVMVLLVFRSTVAGLRSGPRHLVALPGLPASIAPARGSWLRFAPAALFTAGLPFLLLALAGPYSQLVAEEVTFPGRRIALMLDASSSMQQSFTAATLNTRAETEPAFFATVGAARRFVELRRAGKYRDLMALVEFGSRAYVITPFTTDIDNLLLSMALIADPVEFSMFPDPGTIIAQAVEQSIELFRAFDVLEASGNLMVIFTDGEDTQTIVHGRTLDDILQSAIENKIPLYFVRTNYDKGEGEIIPDVTWRAAVERTGGRFYAASDEATLLRAIHDINSASTGAIQVRQYTSQQPRFTIFVLAALILWSVAAAVKLGLPMMQKLP